MNICFDVNGCLLDSKLKPISANIELLKKLCESHKVYIWSGNGFEYALQKMRKYIPDNYICGYLDKYGTFRPDVAFDDQEIDLGKLNIKI
jgi:hydroxymethylpyrimidine pyrophosphatase-like HAD family hydrolase